MTNKLLYIALLLLTPTISFAAPRTFAEFLWIFTNIFNLIIQVLIVATFVAFLWGVVKTIFSADDANQREQGRKALLFSIFALFSLVSVWGIVYVVQRTFFF